MHNDTTSVLHYKKITEMALNFENVFKVKEYTKLEIGHVL